MSEYVDTAYLVFLKWRASDITVNGDFISGYWGDLGKMFSYDIRYSGGGFWSYIAPYLEERNGSDNS
jgi:hypothetical protein